MVVFWKVVAVVVLKGAVHLSFLSSLSFGKHKGGGRRECQWTFRVEGVSPDLSLSVGPGHHRQL